MIRDAATVPPARRLVLAAVVLSGCCVATLASAEVSGASSSCGEVWPRAMYDMVMRITRDYDRPIIEITENGCAYNDGPNSKGAIVDTRRITYHQQHLSELARAIRDGADVRGYHAWSLLDNFEWAEGLSQRFGLAYVDFKTQKRTLKASGLWYAKLASKNGFFH